ncbi:MAG TPA: CDGSH iron-sulfur domain-containing protein, partial [Candidatus Nanoarchaeia archaeon]|nr:CDGSH iron-sulfur domain-containing protein [Candidatus Nanoarchaeia archaeon]
MTTDKSKEKEATTEVKIEVTKNGPYIVSGKVPIFEQIIIVDKDGIPIEWRKGKVYPPREKCGLCRCGQTKNKPYCDGSHIKASFDGTEEADFEPFNKKAKIIEGPELNLADVEELC